MVYNERPKEPRLIEDTAAAIFRAKRPLAVTCAAFSIAVLVFVITAPRRYQSQVEFFVRNSRSATEISPYPVGSQTMVEPVSDTQIGTEMQFLASNDLRREVILAVDPAVARTGEQQVDAAIRKLNNRLKVTPLPKTGIIRVTYSGTSASEANATLKVLSDLYLTRHVRMHGDAHVYTFFRSEAEQYQKELEAARQALTAYEKTNQISLLPVQKDIAVHKLAEARATLHSNGAELDESQARLAKLSAELTNLQPRIVTQQRSMPSQYAAERLNTLLVELNNKRTNLLTQFRPDDRRITELDSEIAQTATAAKAAAAQQTTEQTTDLNPIRQSLDAEIARVRISGAALRSREQSLAKQLSEYQSEIQGLDSATGRYEQLEITTKQAEDNYNLYARKAEEARIAEALDSEKIGNVAIADGPSYPVFPESRFGLSGASALLLGNFVIIGLFTAWGVRRRLVFTPLEAELLTGFPVLATVPYENRPINFRRLPVASRVGLKDED